MSTNGAARAPSKRRDGAMVCATADCNGHIKGLGAGDCEQCCIFAKVKFIPISGKKTAPTQPPPPPPPPQQQEQQLSQPQSPPPPHERHVSPPISPQNPKSSLASDDVISKLDKNHFVEGSPVRSDLPTSALVSCPTTLNASSATDDLAYFIDKTRLSVMSVDTGVLRLFMIRKQITGVTKCEDRESLIKLLAVSRIEYDVPQYVSSSDDEKYLPSKNAQRTPSDNDAIPLPPKKKTSPLKEMQSLQRDTASAMNTFHHRQIQAKGGAAAVMQPDFFGETAPFDADIFTTFAQQGSERLESNTSPVQHDVFLVLGIDTEARWISEEIGYGIFTLRVIPRETMVTRYDGPRVDCQTGQVLFECPITESIEKIYASSKKHKWVRSRKWGNYEREHCVLLEHSSTVCICGTFSSQPFLFSEAFHGGAGYASSFNSGTSFTSNMKKVYRRCSRFPRDKDGQLDQVRTSTQCTLMTRAALTRIFTGTSLHYN